MIASGPPVLFHPPHEFALAPQVYLAELSPQPFSLIQRVGYRLPSPSGRPRRVPCTGRITSVPRFGQYVVMFSVGVDKEHPPSGAGTSILPRCPARGSWCGESLASAMVHLGQQLSADTLYAGGSFAITQLSAFLAFLARHLLGVFRRGEKGRSCCLQLRGTGLSILRHLLHVGPWSKPSALPPFPL